MADEFQPIHPRKLHGTLLALKSREVRVSYALTFLCRCTGAGHGYRATDLDYN